MRTCGEAAVRLRVDPVVCWRSWTVGAHWPMSDDERYRPLCVLFLGPLILWVVLTGKDVT